MIIFPAIDIKNGKVVRLAQGKFHKVTEYAQDPVDVAKQWVDQGAQWIHVVDLDGAQQGRLINQDAIINIAKSIPVPVQMGGGIRFKDDIAQLLDGGVARIILGTKIIEDRQFLKDVLSTWREKIAVSLDCSNGLLTQKGWTETSSIRATEFVKELEILGLTTLIYTDIARDGMLTGPNLEALKEILKATFIPVIASGGISSIEDIKALCDIKDDGLIGAITGKALYEDKLDLKEAIKLCSQNG